MDLTIRILNEADYDTILTKWWSDWGWSAPPKEFLPSSGTGGYIVYDGEEPVCAGFLYTTNSRVAWVDWIISSKTYRKKPTRAEALALLVSALTDMAIQLGNSFCYALIKHPSLIKTYEEIGYTQGETYNTEMIIKL